MPEFWSNLSSCSERQNQFVTSFLKIMSLLKTSKSPLDPSQFLHFLKQIIVRSGRADFNIFQPQDACEVLGCMLDEFCSESILASNLTKIHVKNTVSCNSCTECNISEDPLTILQLPVSESVQSSINSFLKPENLVGITLIFAISVALYNLH